MIGELSEAELQAAADFLDGRTCVHRWLVAFLRNFEGVVPGDPESWSIWKISRPDGSGNPGLAGVIAHSFHTATTYLTIEEELDLAGLEDFIASEVLPEKMVGDGPGVATWEQSSPGFFDRARRRREIAVLALRPGDLPSGLVPREGFRPAALADAPVLRELEVVLARELDDPDPESDLESLIEREMVFVLEVEGRVAAAVRSNLSDGRFVQAGAVIVDPGFRGRGIGPRILAGLCERIHRGGAAVVLDAYRENLAALGAYRAVGFREIGGGVAWYFTEDAWRMSR